MIKLRAADWRIIIQYEGSGRLAGSPATSLVDPILARKFGKINAIPYLAFGGASP